MEAIVVFLVIISALLHTYWNTIFKQEIDRGAKHDLYWFCAVAQIVILGIPALWLFITSPPPIQGISFAIVGGLSLGAFLILAGKVYQLSNFSESYPLMRTLPLFTLIIGVLFLGETVSAIAKAGIAIILLGIFGMQGFDWRALLAKGPLLAIGVAIINALYGTFSKLSVESTHPILFMYISILVAVLVYAPKMLKRPVIQEMRTRWSSILQIAMGDLFSYGLVLVVLTMDRLSYIFALRQISIFFSVLVGIVIFKEAVKLPRIASAVVILIGAVLIGLG